MREGKPNKPERKKKHEAESRLRDQLHREHYRRHQELSEEGGPIGSKEYNELAKVRRDFPDFRIQQREITKKQDKKTYGKLTYKVMGEFIEAQEEENAAEVLAEFERVQRLSKIQAGSYSFVKTWFLNRYKDVFEQEEEACEEVA